MIEDTDQDKKQILKAITPTKYEVIGLISFSLIFLSVFAALEYFQDIDSSSYENAAKNIEEYIRGILGIFDKYLGVTFLTLIFWMLIGTVVYSLVWIGISTFTAYKDDLPNTKGFVFPRGYKKTNVIHESMAKIAMRTASAIMLGFWLYLLLAKAVPFAIRLFSISSEEGLVSSILQCVLATIFLSVCTFIVFIFSRLALLRTRIFYGPI